MELGPHFADIFFASLLLKSTKKRRLAHNFGKKVKNIFLFTIKTDKK
jgi:hypothetical protein